MRNRISASVVTLLCLVSLCAGASIAQTPQAGADWTRVQALTAGTMIRVASERRPTVCSVVSVGDDRLRCTATRSVLFFPVHQEMEFARTEVRSVKLSRQGLSTLTGTAIGAGAGAGIGAGIDAQARSNEDGHLATALFSILGGALGAGIGRHTDFVAGPTVYRAP